MSPRSPWRLIVTALVIIAIALLIRVYAGPLKHWLIAIHGGGGGGH